MLFDCIIAVNSLDHADKIRLHLEKGGFPVKVIGVMTEGKGLLNIVSEFRVDLLIIEADLKHIESIRSLKDSLRPQSCCAVILASRREDFSYEHASEAIEIGVQGYILLPVEEKHLARAMGNVISWLYTHNARNIPITDTEPLAESSAEQSKTQDMAKDIYEFIVENYVQPLTMADIVNKFYISESYVNRLLMKNYGNSFKKILNKVRLDQAQKLIREHPEMLISEVASKVGYQDPYYFNRLYKAYKGVTPSADRDIE